MSSLTYDDLLTAIRQLSLEEQARLLQELAQLVYARIKAEPAHSIREFRGLGKEIWQGIDVEQYINQERNSWD
ncbi:MAG TPA: hypothetical protein VFA41_00470 [Ktedonobacteraceae bacterium]|jgi:hypothetical protein|nr:hypothetical protein [Ktedonobacteraceae bacterium]